MEALAALPVSGVRGQQSPHLPGLARGPRPFIGTVDQHESQVRRMPQQVVEVLQPALAGDEGVEPRLRRRLAQAVYDGQEAEAILFPRGAGARSTSSNP